MKQEKNKRKVGHQLVPISRGQRGAYRGEVSPGISGAKVRKKNTSALFD